MRGDRDDRRRMFQRLDEQDVVLARIDERQGWLTSFQHGWEGNGRPGYKQRVARLEILAAGIIFLFGVVLTALAAKYAGIHP